MKVGMEMEAEKEGGNLEVKVAGGGFCGLGLQWVRRIRRARGRRRRRWRWALL